MADVFRRATKSVHRSIRDGGERFDVNPCNLDPGGTWLPTIPPGPRCPVCFDGRNRRQRRNKRLATAGGSAGVLALVAIVLAGQPNGDPVSSPRGTWSPGRSDAPLTLSPIPTETAGQASLSSFTPAPTTSPSSGPTKAPAPTAGPVVPPGPRPTVRPTPDPTAGPTPEPTCFHPGHNYGVDECRWPHN